MSRDGDTDPSGVAQQPHDELAMRMQRVSASQNAQSRADLNARTPAVQIDPVSKRRFYETAPAPLTRLLGSPLAQSGKYVGGPHGERRIFGGWGDARPSGYDQGAPRTFHKGLDFAAPEGEPVLACGDGTVTFVGYQSKTSGVSLPGAHTDKDGNILNAKGDVAAGRTEIGFGGIFIYVKHHNKSDFPNYRTEYFHLSNVAVKEGDEVTEGQVIGYIGHSGVPGIGPHLHFQVSYVAGRASALVNPTSLVPNYWPGHMDSTNSDGARGLALPPLAVAGLQVSSSQAANMIVGLDRATTMQNQDVAAVRQRWANHAARNAQVTDVQQTALYAAAGAFKGAAPVVSTPMTFDFTTGTWSDGKVT